MSSSSDSEDNEKFKLVCDPQFAIKVHSKLSNNPNAKNLLSCSATSKVVNEKPSDAASGDPRPSFQILKSLNCALKTRSIKDGRRGEKLLQHLCVQPRPPATNAHLGRMLDELLNRHLTVEEAQTDVHPTLSPPGLQLLPNVYLSTGHTADTTTTCAPKRAVRRIPECRDSSDEEEVLGDRCRSVALDIATLMDAKKWPWVHPRNLRHYEDLVLTQRLAGGSVVATPRVFHEACGATSVAVDTKIHERDVTDRHRVVLNDIELSAPVDPKMSSSANKPENCLVFENGDVGSNKISVQEILKDKNKNCLLTRTQEVELTESDKHTVRKSSKRKLSRLNCVSVAGGAVLHKLDKISARRRQTRKRGSKKKTTTSSI